MRLAGAQDTYSVLADTWQSPLEGQRQQQIFGNPVSPAGITRLRACTLRSSTPGTHQDPKSHRQESECVSSVGQEGAEQKSRCSQQQAKGLVTPRGAGSGLDSSDKR